MPSIPTWSTLLSDPQNLRRLMRAWPPYAGSGIRMVEIADDWSRVVMESRLRPWTANFVGTQFGGSMFAMTDPWPMILMMRRLGPDHVVWDRAGEIEFLAPGRSTVRASFDLTDAMVEQVRTATADGAKVLQWYSMDVVSSDGTVVARVRKQLYIRRKRQRPGD